MTTPKEALEFYADPENWKCGSILDMESSHFDGWTKAQQALASLQGEDAVERVAAVIRRAMLDNPTGGTSEERAAKRKVIATEYAAAYVADCATGLVPDEAAIRTDEREKCARIAEAKYADPNWHSAYHTASAAIAAAIRSQEAGR